MRNPEHENVLVGRKDVLVGRVDLVRALSAGGVELQEALADLVGFQREPAVTPPPEVDTGPGQSLGPQPEAPQTTRPPRPGSILAGPRFQGVSSRCAATR